MQAFSVNGPLGHVHTEHLRSLLHLRLNGYHAFYGAIHIKVRQTSKITIKYTSVDAQCEWTLVRILHKKHPGSANGMTLGWHLLYFQFLLQGMVYVGKNVVGWRPLAKAWLENRTQQEVHVSFLSVWPASCSNHLMLTKLVCCRFDLLCALTLNLVQMVVGPGFHVGESQTSYEGTWCNQVLNNLYVEMIELWPLGGTC